MEDVVGIVVTSADGREGAFITWGRIFDAVDPTPLIAALRPHLVTCGIEADATIRVCDRLSEVKEFPYFYEGLLEFARSPIPSGERYEQWVEKRRAALRREVYFLGFRTS